MTKKVNFLGNCSANIHTILYLDINPKKWRLKLIKDLRKRFRTGNLVSRILRIVFERPWIKTAMGVPLAAGVISMGAYSGELSSSALPAVEPNPLVLETPEIFTTETTFHSPVTRNLGVSQRFFSYHKGYDIRSPLGSSVSPISGGQIAAVTGGFDGYGNRVIVNHGNGLSSLYAHLGEMNVKIGQIVSKNDKIGEIGMTGWTTGPHLHLEIYQNGIPVNPRLYLDY